MTNSILINNGRIIDPSQKMDSIGSLLIVNGRIAWVGDNNDKLPASDYGILDAKGLIICPGFIDMHCHLRQPGFEEKETISSGSRAAAKGGFTTICCMPNTNPPLDSQGMIDYIKVTATNEGATRVLPIGCISRARAGKELVEMGELAEAGVIGFSDDGEPVKSSRLMRQAMEYSLAFGLPIIEHCEDTLLSENGQMNEGIIATKLGLCGIPNAAEENIVSRDIALAELTGARLHVAHVSTRGSVELLRRAKEKDLNITAEVTPHHLTLTEDRVINYDTNAKVNPPLRTEKDVETLIAALKEGVIDIIVTDHAPHTDNDKLCEFALAPFGMSVFETAISSLLKLVHQKQIDIKLLISKLTAEPAKIIGNNFGKLGTLTVGETADITILNPDIEWVVDVNRFVSKGKNNPLNGEKFKGKVMATIHNGKFTYRDDSIKPRAKV
ncbi:MAG: dihydroorotase [Dehalococcoidia bacterium]|nr:MAG: dihydroorotase [Dehalococcoidia bacterium]